MKTYTIDVALIGKFEAKLESFKKKFSKYGDGGITYVVSDAYMRETAEHKKQLVVDVDIDASYKIDGYEFVALLEMTTDGKGNLVKKISDDVVVPEMYRTRCECDHCKASRVRKYTVLLKNSETGEYVQVGKSCVKDYIGQDMSHYASYLDFYSTLDDVEEDLRESFPRSTPGFSFEEVVEQTWEYVKRFGYVSKSMAMDDRTKDATSSSVYAAINYIMTDTFEKYPITDDSVALTKKVMSFIEELDNSSDYNYNLKMLLSAPFISNKNVGLVVSSVGYYLRETAKKVEKEDTVPSNYIGEVGGKIEFTSTPECVYSALGEFGWTYIYRMTSGNDVIVWKTNKCLEEGTTVTIKATIKEHSEYRGVKQTTITRGRVVA